MSSAGDVNGDGFDDLLIGADRADASGSAKSSAGESYVIFGGNSFTNSILPANLGTNVSNMITGTAGAEILNGADGDDTLVGGGGADTLLGGRGNDILAVSDLTFKRIVGGTGTDTLRLDGSSLTLNLTTLADNRILGVEQIDLTGSGNNTLTLDVQEVLNISDESNTLVIRRNVGDTVNIGSGWTQGANETIGSDIFEVFNQGQAVIKLQVLPTRDFGDAPLPYPASGGHTATGPRLGATRDLEFGIQRSAAADGDGSDEDGVLFGTINTAMTLAAVNIDLQNATNGRVDGWIDFNGDGDWNDTGEQIFANTAVLGGIQTLNYTIPVGAVAGNTIARIRVSSSGGLTTIASANDGEIEDYRVTIGTTPSTVVLTTVNNTNTTRSEVTSIAVDFDSVVPVQASDFILRNTTTNQTVTGIAVQTQSTDGTTRATLTFTNGPSIIASTHASVLPSLANGAYTLRYLPTETPTNTAPIDAFFRKYGDADGSNLVALTDFATFRSVFGSSVGEARYRADLDSDRDGIIALIDFAAFRSGFGS